VSGVETFTFADDGGIPNSHLPVLYYRDVEGARDAAACERLFASHRWSGGWWDGIYPFHHFHSTSHEVLGIVRGTATVHLGGPAGRAFEVRAGDVLVLHAGTGHKNDGASADLLVVGAYPDAMTWDLRRGDPGEHDEVAGNIARVPLPATDPVYGAGGPLSERWG
jgi:uncharacterized protein YjlB